MLIWYTQESMITVIWRDFISTICIERSKAIFFLVCVALTYDSGSGLHGETWPWWKGSLGSSNGVIYISTDGDTNFTKWMRICWIYDAHILPRCRWEEVATNVVIDFENTTIHGSATIWCSSIHICRLEIILILAYHKQIVRILLLQIWPRRLLSSVDFDRQSILLASRRTFGCHFWLQGRMRSQMRKIGGTNNWRHGFNVSIPQNRQLARQKQSHLQPETTKNSILAAAFCLLMKDNANEFDDDHKTHECHCLETTCHTKSWPAKVKVSPPSGLFKNKQSAFKLLSWQESYYWISSSMCLIVSRSWLADVMLTRWSLEFRISIELCIGTRGLRLRQNSIVEV